MRTWRGTTPRCPAQLPHFFTCASVERDDAQLSCAAATLLNVCERGEGRRPAVLRSCHTSQRVRAWRRTTPSCPAQLPHFLTCASVERDDAQLSCAAATLLNVCERGEGRRPAVLRSCHTSQRVRTWRGTTPSCLLNVCERGEGRRPAVLRSCHTSYRVRAWRGTTPSCPAQLLHFLPCASVERDDAQLSCAAATLLTVCERGEGRRPAVLRSCYTSYRVRVWRGTTPSCPAQLPHFLTCASVERDDAQLSCAAATLLNVCERGEGRRPAVLRSCHTS